MSLWCFCEHCDAPRLSRACFWSSSDHLSPPATRAGLSEARYQVLACPGAKPSPGPTVGAAGSSSASGATRRRSAPRPSRGPRAVDRAVGERAVDRVVVSVVGSPIPVAKGLKLRFPDAVHFDVDDQLGHAPASNGPLACGIAVEWIRQAEAQTVLVLSVSRDAGSMALVWATPTEPLENAR